jgi:dihydropteroate synthase
MKWLIHQREHDLSQRGMIMGIVNVTPDSFSDGGRYFDPSLAIEHGRELIREGADILDIGGESTRPGAEPVSAEEELRRVIPVIAALRAESDVLISVDTFKASVASAALQAGADIINDVSGLLHDPAMLDVARASSVGIVLMHMKGEPRTMQMNPHYDDVVAEVRAFFAQRIAALSAAGIDSRRLVLDPGIGFGKNLDHNLALLRALPLLVVDDRPLLLGVSRKSMIGKVIGSDRMEDRAWPTVALTSYAREHGTRIVRVHDVKPNADALRMTEAILNGWKPE